MAEPREFYKTIISFTVLSEGKIPDGTSLESMIHETCEGRYVGSYHRAAEILMNGPALVGELREVGSEPGFFELNEDGTDYEEPYDFEEARRGECTGCDDDECDNYVQHLIDDDPFK